MYIDKIPNPKTYCNRNNKRNTTKKEIQFQGGSVILLIRRVVGSRVREIDGDDSVVGAVKVLGGNVEGLVRNALGSKVELDRAELALSVTIAGVTVTREAHGHGALASEGNKAQSVGDELVVENGGVDFNFHQVDGNGWDFGDHDSPERVGHASVGVSQLELQVVVFHFSDLDFGKPLIRLPFHFSSSGA